MSKTKFPHLDLNNSVPLFFSCFFFSYFFSFLFQVWLEDERGEGEEGDGDVEEEEGAEDG